jgi:hypothetical protein
MANAIRGHLQSQDERPLSLQYQPASSHPGTEQLVPPEGRMEPFSMHGGSPLRLNTTYACLELGDRARRLKPQGRQTPRSAGQGTLDDTPAPTSHSGRTLSPGRRMNASGGGRTTDSRTERGAGVALAAIWRPHSKRGHSEASFPGPRMAALTPLMPTATLKHQVRKTDRTTKDPIISPKEAADPLKPLTPPGGFRAPQAAIRRSGCSRHPVHSWRR